MLYDTVGTVNYFEHSTICILTCTKMRMGMFIVPHDLSVGISFINYPQDFSR